jgi:hypothetical protein
MTHEGGWRMVGIVLALGAGYDLVFGLAILGFTRPAAAILGLRVPDDPVYLYLNGVFLLVLAGIYTVAARAPERYRAIAPISAGGRTLGFLLFAWAWAHGRPATFLALGLADLALAAVTLVAWRRAVRLSD